MLRKILQPFVQHHRLKAYSKGAWKLTFRHLLPSAWWYPVEVKTQRDHVRLYLSEDVVDEKIALYFHSIYRSSYFPELPLKIPDNPTILDLGAHHGIYTVHALAMYPQGQIICVEPNIKAIPLIEKNLNLNGWRKRAKIIHAGLGDTSTKGYLKLSKQGSWGDSLFEIPEETEAVQEVPLLTLDEILSGDKPDIIKCNAEGAEFELVKQLIKMQWQPMLLSIAVHEEFGNLDEILSPMQNIGYQMMQTGESHRPVFHFWKQ